MHIFTDLDGTLIQDGNIKENDIMKIRKFTVFDDNKKFVRELFENTS